MRKLIFRLFGPKMPRIYGAIYAFGEWWRPISWPVRVYNLNLKAGGHFVLDALAAPKPMVRDTDQGGPFGPDYD